jgi:hypothetical protein
MTSLKKKTMKKRTIKNNKRSGGRRKSMSKKQKLAIFTGLSGMLALGAYGAKNWGKKRDIAIADFADLLAENNMKFDKKTILTNDSIKSLKTILKKKLKAGPLKKSNKLLDDIEEAISNLKKAPPRTETNYEMNKNLKAELKQRRELLTPSSKSAEKRNKKSLIKKI